MKFFVAIVLSGLISCGVLSQTPESKASEKQKRSSGREKRESDNTARAEPVKTPDEKTEWEKVLAIESLEEKALRAKEFIVSYPASQFKEQALDLVIRSTAQDGRRLLQNGELDAAVVRFFAALSLVTGPINEQLFKEVFSQLPGIIYSRGAREDAFRVASVLEEKAEGNPEQLLALARFYLSVENGSKARQLAELTIKVKPDSAPAFQVLGLANRMDFRFEESAAAYERALVLEPESAAIRQGLAEMKRSLGKPDEAVMLFGETLSKDPNDVAARSGLILSHLDAEKRSDAEAEMAKFLETNAGNVVLLGGAAYWYASRGEGEKAIEYAQKAIQIDPRYIWSHLALARGYLVLNRPLEAEKTLLAARRYGNFPTIEYEIASARLAAGFFRDAADELSKSFSITDGLVQTKLGGRVLRTARNFSELVEVERRASILTPTPPASSQTDGRLFALLELKQALNSSKSDSPTVLRAVDQFVQGDDGMKLHRRLFAAGQLLEKRIEPERVAEIAQAAIADVDAGLNTPSATAAVLASELYENRAIAVSRGEYLNVPDVPRPILSAIVRGRIEEISGWARYLMDDSAGAVIRLKRAVSILPAKSAWRQSAAWRLGNALALNGKEAEALDTFIATYKEASQPDRFRYDMIAALYQKVHGSTDDLESIIGPNPAPPVNTSVAAPEVVTETPAKSNPDGEQGVKPTTLPTPVPAAQPEAAQAAPQPIPTSGEKSMVQDSSIQSATPESGKIGQAADLSPPAIGPTGSKEANNSTATNAAMFPPVVITIPAPHLKKPLLNKTIPYLPNPVQKSSGNDSLAEKQPSGLTDAPPDESLSPVDRSLNSTDASAAAPVITPCKITSSDESLTLLSGSGGKAVIIGIDDETSLEGLKGISSSPENVDVRREPIPGIISRALYVIRSENGKAGVYQVTFELPCGKKVIVVNVR